MQKKSFIMFVDYLDYFEELNDEELGTVMRAVFRYEREGIEPKAGELTLAEKIVFKMIKNNNDRNADRYAEICEKRREAGKRGGRPRKDEECEECEEEPEKQTKAKKANGFSEKQTKAKKANGFSEKQTKAKKADNVTVNENVNGNENDNENGNDNDNKNKTDSVPIYPSHLFSSHIFSSLNQNEITKTIKHNIDYDILKTEYSGGELDNIVDIIVEVICSTSPFVKISGNEISIDSVRDRFLRLDCEHIRFVLECFEKNSTKVKKIKAYLIASLYNAPATMSSYYTAEVNHDMKGG